MAYEILREPSTRAKCRDSSNTEDPEEYSGSGGEGSEPGWEGDAPDRERAEAEAKAESDRFKEEATQRREGNSTHFANGTEDPGLGGAHRPPPPRPLPL